MKPGLDLYVLLPFGKILLLGAVAFTLFQVIRGHDDFTDAIEKIVLGVIAIHFYKEGFQAFQSLSNQLEENLKLVRQSIGIKDFLIDAHLKAAFPGASSPSVSSFNIPELLEQAVRTGVWGIMSTIIEFIFMLSGFFIECAKSVFWKLILFLCPIAAGLYPVFPKLLKNLLIYASEITLWTPILWVIDLVVSESAREFVTRSGSLGLYIVAVELIGAILILVTPIIASRFISGTLSGDMGLGSPLVLGKKLIKPFKIPEPPKRIIL